MTNSRQTQFRYYNLFFRVSMIFLSILLIPVIIWDKADFHLWTNQFHTGWADTLMKYWTNLGDGLILPAALLVLLFLQKRMIWFYLLSVVLAGACILLTKYVLFTDFYRPAHVIGREVLYLIEGVSVHSRSSFISGHTTTAFVVFYFFSLLTRKPWLQFVLCIMAIGVAISRVYLSQHFWMDVFAGTIVGIFAVIAADQILFRSRRRKSINLADSHI